MLKERQEELALTPIDAHGKMAFKFATPRLTLVIQMTIVS
jgi:hypothetical protein